MKRETVIDRAPAVRCYKCGSTEIFSLCHHVGCAKPMCREHSPHALRQGGQPVHEVADEIRDSVRLASAEFAWLKQSDRRRMAVYHCEEHAHSAGNGMRLIAWGALIAAVGVIMLIVVPLPGVTLLLIGVGLAVAGILSRARGLDPASRPPLPLFPHVNTVDLTERLAGHVSFADGSYTSAIDGDATGDITLNMSANDGQQWLRRYRRRYRLSDDAPVPFAAGFVLLKGKSGLHFHAGQEVVLKGGNGLSLSGASAAGHQLFEDVPGRPPGEWVLSAGYQVRKGNAPKDIPLWIVPSVLPSSDRRTLEIDLHWNRLGPEDNELTLARFESIELRVPSDWGVMQASEPGGPTIGLTDDGHRTIRWHQVPGSQGGKSRTLRLRFEEPVLPSFDADRRNGKQAGDGTPAAEPEPKFTGTLTAIFEGLWDKNTGRPRAVTLSGAEGVDFYLPGGGRASQHPAAQVRVEVTVQFSIGLGAIRYRDGWTVPGDPNARQAQDGRADDYGLRRQGDEFWGVVPDHSTVIELVNLISKQGYYVKSVVEHPPYNDVGRENVVNRVWDIEGRWYQGVFPVDFNINLTGEEAGEDGRGPAAGKTVAQVTVNGTYANEPGQPQQRMIEDKWDHLYGEVTSLLRRRCAGSSGARAIGGPSATIGWSEAEAESEVTGQDGTARFYGAAAPDGRPARDALVVDAELVETDGDQPRLADNDGAARRGDLRRKREAAEDAVLEGRISEETFHRIIARIDEELQ